jgi:hypothetical protein
MLYIDNYSQLCNDIFTPEPHVPGSPMAYLPCLRICWYRSFRLRASHPLYEDLWLFANGEAVWYSILPCEGLLLILGAFFYTVSIGIMNRICGLRRALIDV